jgi:hypothetical protein
VTPPVFVLHEVFGYAHAEIAGILDRSLGLIPDGDKVRGIYVITNPGKLSRLG